MSIGYERWPGAEALAQAGLVWPVYDQVFGDQDDEGTWRRTSFEPHTAREGFLLVAARDRSLPGAPVIGFAYAYVGHRGEYWPDLVARAVGPEVQDHVGGHWEVVELAVRQAYRGRGIGRRLHDELLVGSGCSYALLSTDAMPTPAVQLYRSAGWTTLGLLDRSSQVMGLALPVRHIPQADPSHTSG